MEKLATNAGKPERRTLNGRSYLVAPATLIVSDRVLEGSQGRGFYPAEEVESDPLAWNRMPLVLWHPKDEQGYVTARTPAVLEAQQIGDVYEATVGGKLAVQAWFDEELTKRRDEQYKLGRHAVYPRLLRGDPIELSTGLFPTYDRTPGVNAAGDAYDWVARDIAPDHVAVLPDEIGACSVNDGCGVFNAGLAADIPVGLAVSCETPQAQAADQPTPTPEQRKRGILAKIAELLGIAAKPDPPAPVDADPAPSKAQTTESTSDSNEETDMPKSTIKFDRQKAVALVGNCAALKKAWTPEALSKLTDDQLRPLAENARMIIVVNSGKGPKATNDPAKAWNALSKPQLAALIKAEHMRRIAENAEDEMEAAGVDIAGLAEFLGVAADPASDPVSFVNELKGKLDEISAKLGIGAPPAPEPSPEEPAAEILNAEDEEKKKKDDEAMAGNRSKRLTPEEQEAIAYANNHRRQARAKMVAKLSANARNPKTAAKVYEAMTDKQLVALVNELKDGPDDDIDDDAPPARNRRTDGQHSRGDDRPQFFFGSGGDWDGSEGQARNRRARRDDDEPSEEELATINMMTPRPMEYGKKGANAAGTAKDKAAV